MDDAVVRPELRAQHRGVERGLEGARAKSRMPGSGAPVRDAEKAMPDDFSAGSAQYGSGLFKKSIGRLNVHNFSSEVSSENVTTVLNRRRSEVRKGRCEVTKGSGTS